MVETYTDIPTLFEIKIREDGWIYNVFVDVDNKNITATWVESIENKYGRYSVFEAYYTFDRPMKNVKATFHYSVDDKKYDCEPLYLNVEP